MDSLLWRLHQYGVDLPAPCDDGKAWVFYEKLRLLSKDLTNTPQLISYFVKNHQRFNIEYSVYCARLSADLVTHGVADAHVSEQLTVALMLAEIQEHIYHFYLNVPREVARLRRDQTVYRTLLAQQYDFKRDALHHTDTAVSRRIRELTPLFNMSRLFTARMRRLLIAALPLATGTEGAGAGFNRVDAIAIPVLTYASWLFFLPRIMNNFCMMAKHVIPSQRFMSDEERSLGWRLRLQAQISRRWFELGNDIAALVVNSVICFALMSATLPLSFYATIVLLTYDIGLAALRAHVELSRLLQLEADYIKDSERKDMSPEQRAETKAYLFHLQQRIYHEKKRMIVFIVNTNLLLFSFALTMPLFVLNPVIPLIGALLAVLVTIACYVVMKWIDRQKPNDKVVIPPAPKEEGTWTPSFFPDVVQKKTIEPSSCDSLSSIESSPLVC